MESTEEGVVTPAEWTATAAVLQFTATAILVGVTWWYARHARRQADAAEASARAAERSAGASERSLRFVTRQERRAAVEELNELLTRARRYRSKTRDLVGGGALRRMLERGDSHPFDAEEIERMRALAAALMPLRLGVSSRMLDAVKATERAMGLWGEAQREVNHYGAEEGEGMFGELQETVEEGHRQFSVAVDLGFGDLWDLPDRPV